MEQNREEQSFTGTGCFYHPIKTAQVQCIQCGRPICQECAHAGKILYGHGMGKSLCLGCAEKFAQENLMNLQKFRSRCTFYFVKLAVGVLAGLAAGILLGRIFHLQPHKLLSFILTLILIGLGVVLLCVPDQMARNLGGFPGAAMDNVPVKILKAIGWVIWVYVSGIMEAIRKTADVLTQLGKIPETMRRHLDAQSLIANYRKFSGNRNTLAVPGTPGVSAGELSQVVTKIVADRGSIPK